MHYILYIYMLDGLMFPYNLPPIFGITELTGQFLFEGW
jgi:hypothetical protein